MQRPIRIIHLDGRHAEGAGGLEIPADVVQEGGLDGRDTQLAAGQLVDPRIGLAETDDRRFDHDVKVFAEPVGRAPAVVAEPVVGEGTDPEATGPEAPDRLQHLRANDTRFGDVGHHPGGIDAEAQAAAVALKWRAERLDGQLAPLES